MIELNIRDMEKAEREYEHIQQEVALIKTLKHRNIVGYKFQHAVLYHCSAIVIWMKLKHVSVLSVTVTSADLIRNLRSNQISHYYQANIGGRSQTREPGSFFSALLVTLWMNG